MIILELTEKQLDELYDEMLSNTSSLARKKCLIIYLRAKGYSRCEIADIARVDEDTVTNHVKIFADSGLSGLLKANYYQPKSQLEPYVEQLKKLFEQNPPHTVNHAIELIFEQTGVRLKHSACQAFLKKIGMKCRRCGLVPGKANDDKEQQKAQQEFHDQKLQPRLDEAKQGKRTVLFVDAAHFVMGAFLGMVWCFTRLLLPSASGRKRHNVLGAYNPITHEAITVTNDTYINQWVFGESLDIVQAPMRGPTAPSLWCWTTPDTIVPVCCRQGQRTGHRTPLPACLSPNLNLTGRLWRSVKKQALYSIHYDKFEKFKKSIDTCIAELSTRFKANMQTLMTMKFQLFSEKTENLPV